MKIINITESKRKHKRYKVFLDNGDEYDFGLKDGKTYIDEMDKVKRMNYWLRHIANDKENQLINDVEPSPATFSAYLLWGKYTNLRDNINWLNTLLEKK